MIRDALDSDEDFDQTATHIDDTYPASDPRSAESRIQNAEDQLTHGIEQLHGRGGHRAAAEAELRTAYEACETALQILDEHDSRGDE